jgi:ParB family transcriptional regulator, chromosome partitioning protein
MGAASRQSRLEEIIMTTETSSAQFRFIPVRHLSLSPLNVRKTACEATIGELAELIHAEGILQNLDVCECPHGGGEEGATHAVVAGGRRWRALQRLVEQGRITPDYPVPCLIVSYERAVQISLAENSGREPMHPADEFEAFRQLIDAGQSIEDVAARFGVTPTVVERRLKLANVSPRFIALYRDGEIALEHLMAFAVTDDHSRQEQAWESLKAFDRTPDMIRRALSQHEVSLREPSARFVGIKAYEKAGGIVHRDLFSEEDGDLRLDGELIRKLATAKLEKNADRLRKEGIAWVHVCAELDYAARAAYGRVKTVLREATDEEQKTFAAIATEREQLQSQIEEAKEDDRLVAELEERMAELDRQEEAVNEGLTVPDPEQQALAGAIVSIGRDGKVDIQRDLLKPEDASRFAQAEKARRRAAADRGARVHSAVLVRRLTSQRTLALQATLLDRPDVALVALTHRLLLKALPMYGCRCDSTVGIELRNAEVGLKEPAGCLAQGALRTRYSQIEAKLPREPEQLFGWLLEQPQSEILSMLAFCVALSVDCVQSDEAPSVADELAEAAGLDMRAWWTATAESYLAHVSRARILEVVREAVSPEVAATLTDLKKGALAATAERRLAGTGWLPPLLRNGAM